MEYVNENYQRTFAFKYLFNLPINYFLKSKTYGVIPLLMKPKLKKDGLLLTGCNLICLNLGEIFDGFSCKETEITYKVVHFINFAFFIIIIFLGKRNFLIQFQFNV